MDQDILATKIKKSSIVKQLSCAAVINLVALLQGASVSTSSIILHELENSSHHVQDSHSHCHRGDNCSTLTDNTINFGPFILFDDFHITQEEGSWIASSWVLGHLVSAMFAGFLSDAIGRKMSLLLDTGVFFLGFLLLATGHLPSCLIVARLLLGYPLVSQVFLCEILDENRRGLGAAIYSVLHSVGFFLVLFSGAFLPWRLAVFLPLVLCLPTFVCILFLHESPDWLRKKGRLVQYKQSMAFYQKCQCADSSPDVQIKQQPAETPKEGSAPRPLPPALANLAEVWRALLARDRAFWRLVALLAALFACLGWCGFSILSFYATEIFTASGSPFSASNTSWITSLTKIVCSMASFYVLHRFNRRLLFLATSLLVFLSFVTMSAYTLAEDRGLLSPDLIASLNFLPMASVIVAYTGYGLGYGVIPSLLAAEMMPVDVRSTAVGFFMTVEMTSTFLLSKLKPLLMDALRIHGLFAMFAGTVLIVIVLTLAFKPRHSVSKV